MGAPAVCLIVAGVVRAALPAHEIALEWQHSVQMTRWREHYRVEAHALLLDEARVQGSGAGMEAGEDAVLRHGWWVWHPQRRMAEFTLSASSLTPDHSLCIDGRCRPLHAWLGAGSQTSDAPITLRPCGSAAPTRPTPRSNDPR